MSELTKVADEINEWAKWCHDNNVKAEVQRTMYRAADEIERLTAEVKDRTRDYNNVMDLLRRAKMNHGTCEPVKLNACTACSAIRQLDQLAQE